MKKLLKFTFSILAATLLLQSCSTTKSLVGAAHGHINGTWTLTNVSYEGLVPGAVQNVFDQAPPAAFIGSTWQLTNSGNGMYTLTDGTSQSIFWSYDDQDKSNPIFQFKKTFKGEATRHIAEGYKLYVSNVDKNYMTLKSPVALGDRTAFVVYSFSKK